MVRKSWYLCIVALFCSCDRMPTAPENFGLPSFFLNIEREDLQTLNSTLFANRYVDCEFICRTGEGSATRYVARVCHHGYSSKLAFKKSFKIKFQETDLFESRSKVVLSAQALDPSMLRYSLAAYLFRNVRLMTSDIRFVVLFVNDECRGLYCLIEPVDECFFRNRGEVVGTFYEAYSGLGDFTFTDGYDVRVGFEKKPIDDGNYSQLEHLIHVLDSTPPSEFIHEIEKVFDVDSYLAYLAVSTLISNTDGFFKNFYLYSPEQRAFQIIPWDLDNTFQPKHCEFTVYGKNSLSKRLLKVEEYHARYRMLLSGLLESEFSQERTSAAIDSLSDHARDAHSADPVLAAKGLDIDREAEKIKDFVRERSAFIKEHLEIPFGRGRASFDGIYPEQGRRAQDKCLCPFWIGQPRGLPLQYTTWHSFAICRDSLCL